jgi:hypothetical protein
MIRAMSYDRDVKRFRAIGEERAELLEQSRDLLAEMAVIAKRLREHGLSERQITEIGHFSRSTLRKILHEN